MQNTSDNILKDAFANALLRTADPWKAACIVFGNDTARALECSQSWPSDLYVLSRQAELLDTMGEDAFLPTKAMTLRRIWETAESSTDRKDKIAAFKLYAEVRGYIEKPGDKININNHITSNRVMIVKDHGSNEDWENTAANQQMKLVANART